VHFQLHRHTSFADEIKLAEDLANALARELHRITKSLYLRCISGDAHAVVVRPMGRKANLAAIAATLQCKKVEIARDSELRAKVGYPSGGVSPLGLDTIPVFMDQGLFDLPTIIIGAGEKGIELELPPFDVREITKAIVLPLAV
jgi:Cys-tRNA(Pro)/Cys-tRNA(Cys) deacylase